MNSAVPGAVPEAEPGIKPADAAKKGSKARVSRRTLIVVGIAVLVAAAGALYIAAPSSSETTDDAYINADMTTVAPKIRGLVAEVLVHDNQTVHAGEPLVRIDAEEFDARVANGNAELADAEAGVASARAALISLDAEERFAAATVRAAQSSIRSADAQASRARADRRRYEALAASGAVATRDVDTFSTAAVTAEQDAARAAALLEVSRQSANVTAAKRASLHASLQKAEAAVARSRAAMDLAHQDQGHALIVAPIDGVVGNRQVQQGDYVQPGTRLLTLVPLKDIYVTANFKETQTGRMRPGQRVTIAVDALPGTHFKGTVESLAPGSGSQFSLLPFEPGTGNFTKIVQRVPVRIRFDDNTVNAEGLRPGLSVTARVALDPH